MSNDASPTWRLRSRRLDVSAPIIMGILNVTPDSFSDGGEHVELDAAIAHALSLVEDGADIIDVGGESTRPGAEGISADLEKARVIPVIEALVSDGVMVSVDTMKPEVAGAALDAGAEIVNDVSGLRDPRMRAVAIDNGAGVVVVHMRGVPRTMQDEPVYGDVVGDVAAYLQAQAAVSISEGMDPESICVDPGIGFGKNVEHNLELMRRLDEIVAVGYPVLVGTSRKSFLGSLLDIPDPRQRDVATAVTTALAFERGVAAVRVHDPRSSRHAAQLARAIVGAHAPRSKRPS